MTTGDATTAPAAVVDLGSCPRYLFRLFVVGSAPRSARSIAAVRRMCEQHLIGRYDLEVVDLLRSPAQAEADDITAAPTLLRVLPLPVRRIVGEIADESEMLIQLGIAAASETPG